MPNPFVTYMVIRTILRAVPGRILIAGAILFLLLGTVLIATGHGASAPTRTPTLSAPPCPAGYYQIPGMLTCIYGQPYLNVTP